MPMPTRMPTPTPEREAKKKKRNNHTHAQKKRPVFLVVRTLAWENNVSRSMRSTISDPITTPRTEASISTMRTQRSCRCIRGAPQQQVEGDQRNGQHAIHKRLAREHRRVNRNRTHAVSFRTRSLVMGNVRVTVAGNGNTWQRSPPWSLTGTVGTPKDQQGSAPDQAPHGARVLDLNRQQARKQGRSVGNKAEDPLPVDLCTRQNGSQQARRAQGVTPTTHRHHPSQELERKCTTLYQHKNTIFISLSLNLFSHSMKSPFSWPYTTPALPIIT